MSINEYPQTLGAITKGKRSMNTPLALRIEHALGLEEGFLMTLQVFFEIKEEKRRQQHVLQGGIPKLRKILFWDTDFEKIDWIQQKKAIIKRVFERGNDLEKQELKRFYGEGVVSEVLSTENTKS